MPLGQPVAKHRVLAEGALLRGVERRPFSEQLTRERELADVVELRRAYDDLFDAFRELEVVGDQRGETRRPPHMVVHLRGVALEPLEERLLEAEVPLSRLLGAGRGSNWLMGLGIQCESFPCMRSGRQRISPCSPSGSCSALEERAAPGFLRRRPKFFRRGERPRLQPGSVRSRISIASPAGSWIARRDIASWWSGAASVGSKPRSRYAMAQWTSRSSTAVTSTCSSRLPTRWRPGRCPRGRSPTRFAPSSSGIGTHGCSWPRSQ